MDFTPQELEAITAEVAKKLAGDSANGNPPPPTETPLAANIAGQQYQWKNQQEFEAQMNQFTQGAAAKIAELQNQLVQAGRNTEGSTVDANVAPPAWDDQTFIKTMTDSPKAGFEYALNQLLFDGKSEKPADDLRGFLADTEETKRAVAAYQFKDAHPEFPGGQQAAVIIDNIRQQMNLPYNAQGLEAAYLMGIQKQVLPNYFAQAQQQQFQQQQAQQAQAQGGQPQQQNPYTPGNGYDPYQAAQGGVRPQGFLNNPFIAPPPFAGGSGSGNYQQSTPDLEALSTEQLEQLIAKLGNK